MKNERFGISGLGFALLVSTVGIGHSDAALIVNVDIDNSASAPGGNWNTLDNRNSTDTNLIDFETGLGTGIDVTTSNWEGETSFNGGWTAGAQGFVDPVPVARDLFFTDAALAGTVTFTNVPSGTYTIDVVSANSGITVVDVRVNGMTTALNFLNLGGVSSDSWDEFNQGQNNYLIFEGISPTGPNGDITIGFTKISGGSALVQAVRLTGTAAVPEASEALFVFVGMTGLLGARRRKR